MHPPLQVVCQRLVCVLWCWGWNQPFGPAWLGLYCQAPPPAIPLGICLHLLSTSSFPPPHSHTPQSFLVALASARTFPEGPASLRLCTSFSNEGIICFLACPLVYKICQENQTPHCSQYLFTCPNQMFMSLNTKLEEKGFFLMGKLRSLSSF